MKQQPAPSFNAAGSFLSANYSLDFGADLQHVIPSEGTWQGDRKKALSLYVDNYANNFAITVTGGNSSSKVPAYTSGFVDVKSYNDIFVVSEGVGKVSVDLSTESTPPGFTSRGNSPAVVNSESLTIAGKINVTNSNNTPIGKNPMVYCPLNNCIYMYCNSSNMVVIDCATNKVIKVWKPAAGYVGRYGCYFEGKIYFSCGNAWICIVDCATNTSIFRSPGAFTVDTIAIHEGEKFLYFTDVGANKSYRIYYTFSAGAVKLALNIAGSPDFVMTFTAGYNSKDSYLYAHSSTYGFIRMANGICAQMNVAIQTLKGCCYLPDKKSIVYFANTAFVSEYDITTGETIQTAIPTAPPSTIYSLTYSITSGNVYLNGGQVYNAQLQGYIGVVAGGVFDSVYCSEYCPINDYVYRNGNDGFVYYGK